MRGLAYTLHRRDTATETIPLEASTAADVQTVFWFDGKNLIAQSNSARGIIPWTPASDGLYLIRVVDDHGRTAERDVTVQWTNGY